MNNTRNQSTIINIRIFHNWIKKKLIDEAVKHLIETYHVNNISLLDLAVGKGGDMQKWDRANIKTVVGLDIDDDSINSNKGAKDRYNELIKKTHKKLNYEFHVMDLSLKQNYPSIQNILNNRKFNIVSCQFAIHYFFRDSDALDNVFKIVGNYLEKDGYFIGTTLNGDKIVKLAGNGTFKNSVFDVKIDKYDENDIYGNQYTMSLGEKNEDHYFAEKPSTEFMVNIHELKRVGEENGLLFLGVTEFSEWYTKYDRSMMRRHKNKNKNNSSSNKLTDDEQVFSFLNFSFVFTKK